MHRASHERSINRKQIEHDFFFQTKRFANVTVKF